MKYCPNCGAVLDDNTASFCSKCGSQLMHKDDASQISGASKDKNEKENKKHKKDKTKKQKTKHKNQKKERKIESDVQPVDDGYDGYYNDVLPPDLDRVKEGLDKELIKKIVAVAVGVIFIISMCVVMLYLL